MNPGKLVPVAIALVLYAAASTGSLLGAINLVRRAQFQLIQKTMASKWPKPPMLKRVDASSRAVDVGRD